MPLLFLLFVLVPLVELALLIRVGGAIGVWPTIAIVLLTAFVGTRMLARQGRATLERARERLDHGEMPAGEIVEGMLLLVGGVLLLVPGFLTDAVGFACLVPASRRWIARRLSMRSMGVVTGRVVPGTRMPPGARTPPGTPPPGTPPPPGAEASGPQRPSGQPPRVRRGEGGDVIEGDYRRVD